LPAAQSAYPLSAATQHGLQRKQTAAPGTAGFAEGGLPLTQPAPLRCEWLRCIVSSHAGRVMCGHGRLVLG